MNLFGFSKDEVIFINNSLTNIKNSDKRTKFQSLCVYLFWLKSGLNQQTIASIFNINQRDVSSYCELEMD